MLDCVRTAFLNGDNFATCFVRGSALPGNVNCMQESMWLKPVVVDS